MAHCDHNRTGSFSHSSIFLGSSLSSYIPRLPHFYLLFSFLFLGTPISLFCNILFSSYVYWTVHHFYSCVKRKTQLDATYFII